MRSNVLDTTMLAEEHLAVDETVQLPGTVKLKTTEATEVIDDEDEHRQLSEQFQKEVSLETLMRIMAKQKRDPKYIDKE